MSKALARRDDERVDWLGNWAFIAVHLLPLAAFWTGVKPVDLLVCAALYFIRIFFITAGYHRYFAHRSYRMGRVAQFLMAFGGGTAVQKGALWWAAHHRHHHKYSDQSNDVHSPLKGFWWSHVGWIMCKRYQETRYDLIRDMARYPELRFLNKYHLIPPIALGLACFLAGGWSMLVVGFFLSTVITWHGTFLINSMTHLFGRRRYVTEDTSRNSLILALVTLGEGWHNNHHYYQSSVKQGFFWWEIDISYYGVVLLEWLGLAHDLRKPPARLLGENRVSDGVADVGMLDARWLEAAAAISDAKRQSAEFYEAQKKALLELIETTSGAARTYYEERLAKLEELIAATAAHALGPRSAAAT